MAQNVVGSLATSHRCSVVKVTIGAEVKHSIKSRPKKLVPWGTDGRLPLSDLDLDLGSGHTAYRRAPLIDINLWRKIFLPI